MSSVVDGFFRMDKSEIDIIELKGMATPMIRMMEKDV